MYLTIDPIVDKFDLNLERYALIMDSELNVYWSSIEIQKLELIKNHKFIAFEKSFSRTLNYFLTELYRNGSAKCIVPKNNDDKIFYQLYGILDQLQNLIAVKITVTTEKLNASINNSTLQLLNYLQQGIIITSINHTIIHFNQYVSKMIPKQYIENGDRIEKLFSKLIEDKNELQSFLRKLMIEKTSVMFYTYNGRFIKIIGYYEEMYQRIYYVFEDISKIGKLINKRDDNDYLSEIGKLTAMIVHEMRNPMTSIKGYFDLLKLEKVEKENYLKIIDDELNRMNQLCTDILFLAKPSQGAVTEVDMYALCQNVIQLMNFEALQNDVILELEFDASHKYIVPGNEVYFKQVMINLVKNAIQSIKEKGIVKIQLIEHIHSIQINVIDSGCGISQEQIDTIFQMFYTTKDFGTGLGLPVVKKVIEQFNGTIEIESKINKGTIFKLTLPTIH